MDVQWYPGHMTKARRMMEENIRLVDLVIELVDARIPLSSRNPDIDALCTGKGRVVLLCKADLADPAKTEEFTEYFRGRGILAVAVDARERKAGEVVRRYIQEAGREKIARDRARGIVGRPLRAMVAGIPNVGKSTFINSFAGRASTKTGNKPGVTRGKQWIRLGGDVELLDTPGILWPKFDNQVIGMRLALVGAIRDEVLDKQELAVWLIDYLEQEYPGVLQQKYLQEKAAQEELQEGEDADSSDREEDAEGTVFSDPEEEAMLPPGYALLLKIAAARRLLMKGGEPDADRAASMLIDDCKNGRIGRISLDRPQDALKMEEERQAYTSARESETEKEAGKKKAAADRRKKSGEAYSDHSRKNTGNTAGKTGGRTGGKTIGRTGGKTTGRNSGNAFGKSSGKSAGRGRGTKGRNDAGSRRR